MVRVRLWVRVTVRPNPRKRRRRGFGLGAVSITCRRRTRAAEEEKVPRHETDPLPSRLLRRARARALEGGGVGGGEEGAVERRGGRAEGARGEEGWAVASGAGLACARAQVAAEPLEVRSAVERAQLRRRGSGSPGYGYWGWGERYGEGTGPGGARWTAGWGEGRACVETRTALWRTAPTREEPGGSSH